MHECRSLSTLMNLVKSCVGTGILTLPIAFKYAGLLGGTVLLLFVALVALHCMHLLYAAARTLSIRSHVFPRQALATSPNNTLDIQCNAIDAPHNNAHIHIYSYEN